MHGASERMRSLRVPIRGPWQSSPNGRSGPIECWSFEGDLMLARRVFLGIPLALSTLLLTAPALADDAKSLVERSLKALYYGGNDMVVQVGMSLITSDGKARNRSLSLLRKN